MSQEKCLSSGCTRTSHVRGVCQVCYSALRHLNSVGALSWDKSVEMGLAFLAAPPGRKKIVRLTNEEHDAIIANFVHEGGVINSREDYDRAIGVNKYRRTKHQIDTVNRYIEKLEDRNHFNDVGRKLAEDAKRAEAQSYAAGGY